MPETGRPTPPARKGVVGDRVIIFCYSYFTDTRYRISGRRVVHVNAGKPDRQKKNSVILPGGQPF